MRPVSCVVALFAILSLAAPGVAEDRVGLSQQVNGTLGGPGGYKYRGCRTIGLFGTGTFQARHIGRGTSELERCVIAIVHQPITYEGVLAFTTKTGATLTGTIGGIAGGPLAVTITG